MTSRKKLILKSALVLGAIPVIIHGYEFGPPAGAVAAPGDPFRVACISAGCHVGTPNSGPGNVRITLPAGNSGTYVPGQKIRLQVTVTDATKAAMGFQMTARSGTGNTTQAGDFTPVDGNTYVVCANDRDKLAGQTCPTNFPIQYVQHTEPGYAASRTATPRGAFTFNVDWTPPASAVGPITLFAAGNAGTGNLQAAATSVYTSNTVLQPGISSTPAPAITSGGIVPVGSSVTTIQPGAWAVIYGTNLATSTASWNGDYPTTLGGASVTVNGKPAYLYFASPAQINFMAPDDTATGTVNVVVTTAGGTSTSTVTLAAASPSLLLFDAKHPAGYMNNTGVFLGPPGLFAGVATAAAKAGDDVVLFGVGFGPTNGPKPVAGQAFTGSAATTTTNAVTLRINNQTVPLQFSGLVSSGLYQFNFRVPAGLGTGDVPIVLSVAGVSTASTNVITLQ